MPHCANRYPNQGLLFSCGALLGTALILFASLSGVAAIAAQPSPKLEFEPCRLSAARGVVTLSAECGELQVAENPDDPGGRAIPIRIAKIRARTSTPAADPIVFLAGGPGQSALESFSPVLQALGSARRERDIILIDQRGTGQSNPLACPPPESLAEALRTPSEQEIEDYTKSCLLQLEADTRFYTTTIAATDIDQIRAALGYEKINLYGVSYGTRLAQTYLRLYPQHVRSITLDGVVPTDLILGLDHDINLERALEYTFDSCASDAQCAESFPDLEQEFAQLKQRVRDNPQTLSLTLPSTGEQQEVTFNSAMLTLAVRILAYTADNRAMLPLLIHDAAATGNYQRLASMAVMIMEDLTSAIYGGLEASVMCTEEVPFYPSEQVARDTLMGSDLVDNAIAQCRRWPAGDVPENFHTLFQSPVPALLLSGQYDPVTPPSYGERAQQQFSNGRHLVVPGQGHNVGASGCVPTLIASFLSTADAVALDASCLENMGDSPFFTRLTGSPP